MHIYELDGERVTSISFKVLRWRALLRHTNYLVKFVGRNVAYNMYGEPLHPDVINISENAREKNPVFQFVARKRCSFKGRD